MQAYIKYTYTIHMVRIYIYGIYVCIPYILIYLWHLQLNEAGGTPLPNLEVQCLSRGMSALSGFVFT